MRHVSAQYIITNDGPMLRRGIITIDDNGIVTAIENTCGDLKEKEAVEFYNGIIDRKSVV